MLNIKDKVPTKVPSEVTFEQTTVVQKIGVDMLISLNTTDRTCITGPDVGLDSRVLVTKEKPHFFFNPTFTVPENLNNPKDDSIIEIQFQNYLGNDKKVVLEDKDREIREAIDYLNNGRQRKTKAKS